MCLERPTTNRRLTQFPFQAACCTSRRSVTDGVRSDRRILRTSTKSFGGRRPVVLTPGRSNRQHPSRVAPSYVLCRTTEYTIGRGVAVRKCTVIWFPTSGAVTSSGRMNDSPPREMSISNPPSTSCLPTGDHHICGDAGWRRACWRCSVLSVLIFFPWALEKLIPVHAS